MCGYCIKKFYAVTPESKNKILKVFFDTERDIFSYLKSPVWELHNEVKISQSWNCLQEYMKVTCQSETHLI